MTKLFGTRRHRELAAELATTRESITRAFTKLREDGIIRQKGSAIEILDLARLQEVARPGTAPIRLVSWTQVELR